MYLNWNENISYKYLYKKKSIRIGNAVEMWTDCFLTRG